MTSIQRARTLAYYAAFIALGLAAALLGPTLPGLAQHTHSELAAISSLFTTRAFGYLLGSYGGGRLYDRLPGHRSMALALGLVALLLALAPLLSTLWLLAAVLLGLGLMEGVVDVGGNTLLMWTHRERVAPFMNGLHFFFGAGAFLAPLAVAAAISLTGDITWAYWVLALFILPIGVNFLRLPDPHPVSNAQASPSRVVSKWLVALIAVFFFLYVGGEVSFGGWIYTFAVTLNPGAELGAAYLTSALWGSLTLGRLAAVPLAARFEPRTILTADLLGCLAGASLVLLASNSLAGIWIGTIVTGVAMASVFPTMLALAQERLTITGQVTGWFFVGAGAGGMMLPWLIGQLFIPIGPRITIVSLLVDLALTLAVFVGVAFYSARQAPAPT